MARNVATPEPVQRDQDSPSTRGGKRMSTDLQIDVSTEQGTVPVTVMHLIGHIGGHNYQQIQARAEKAYEDGARDLILDLTQVTFMSSAGVRAMHAIYTMLEGSTPAQPKSNHLKLLNPPDDIRRLIKTIGFSDLFDIYTDLEEAVASF